MSVHVCACMSDLCGYADMHVCMRVGVCLCVWQRVCQYVYLSECVDCVLARGSVQADLIL